MLHDIEKRGLRKSTTNDMSLTGPFSAPDNDEMEVNENLRMRQLLKVLAVSDVVVYKTRAERLHSGKTLYTNHRFYVD